MLKISAALLIAVFSGPCLADPPADSKQNTPTEPPAAAPAPGELILPRDNGRASSKDCEWACLRWEKSCNVDPRGVYKCSRVCSQFGEQCE